ncbi:hypothetical protein BD311DRAFT_839867 [Dichomitus squalens]|uniref:Uncharacterized protein n=1 Tax=Dichomitus squalens TaxID=114155 RepID=A0A4Q9M627_9APHY|nr:hypothetical protein BD311DRAFT_833840 [Dichomitus squalens]TBU28325.1 hypothetical protein BD311DRAFT_839867 [Dichomitus squalens]
MLDALVLSIVLVDAINSGTSIEGREAAVAAWEVCTEPSTYIFQRDRSTIEDALSISPRDGSVLSKNRDKFDLVTIYDGMFENMGDVHSLVSVLFKAIHETAFCKILKSVSMLLIGGSQAWKHEYGKEETLGPPHQVRVLSMV